MQDDEIAASILAAIEAKERTRQAVMTAWEAMAFAGQMLLDRKNALEHGKWLPWLMSMMPESYLGGRRRTSEQAQAFEAWQRTARNWMRMATIFRHCDPAAIEQAHNIRQLFLLSEMHPEGSTHGGASSSPLLPPDVIGRFQRVGKTLRTELAGVDLRSWPAEQREKLRQETAWMREILAELDALPIEAAA